MIRILLTCFLALPIWAQAQITAIEAKVAISEPTEKDLMPGVEGRWKFKEDPDKDNFYEIIHKQPYKMDRYHIKFWDRHGTNPTYEANLHFSKLGGATWINVPYFENSFSNEGFFFLKVVEINKDKSAVTAVVYHDTHLATLDQAALQKQILANMHNRTYFRDTVHLYKIKSETK